MTENTSDETQMESCPVCKRETDLTAHHLIPKSQHSNKWFKKNFSKQHMKMKFSMCGDCHTALHRIYTEKELGKDFNRPEHIIEDPEMIKFGAFAAKQKGKIRVESAMQNKYKRKY